MIGDMAKHVLLNYVLRKNQDADWAVGVADLEALQVRVRELEKEVATCPKCSLKRMWSRVKDARTEPEKYRKEKP
jgi:hypothetical protein